MRYTKRGTKIEAEKEQEILWLLQGLSLHRSRVVFQSCYSFDQSRSPYTPYTQIDTLTHKTTGKVTQITQNIL